MGTGEFLNAGSHGAVDASARGRAAAGSRGGAGAAAGAHGAVPAGGAANTADPSMTREELVSWLRELLPDPYAFPETIGASYVRDIRELEYVSRPLWAVFSLISSGEYDEELVEPYIRRIREGVSGGPGAFPRPTQKSRQVMVEMGVYGFGLMACGDRLRRLLGDEAWQALGAWLLEANSLELPWGDWYLFRILVNCGLRVAGLPYDPERLRADGRAIESMYAGGGWYENGMPFQRDYYVALTFHFASLMLARYCPDVPVGIVREREAAFESDFTCWFDRQGRSLPFGRSLTYRFGHASFWAACAVSGLHVCLLGEIKWLLMANLAWWRQRQVCADGHLAVGYGYPNMLVGEDYTGPGAPSWALKSLCVLALPSDDPFWSTPASEPARPVLSVQEEPGMLVRTGERHTYALSAMQYSAGGVLQRMSKYGKLCYSTGFGWNLSRDAVRLAGFAVDSALVLGVVGTDQYQSRSRIEVSSVHERYAYSVWSVGSLARVETWLVPVDELWHVRVHHVQAAVALDSHEGAFPVMGWNHKYDEPAMGGHGVTIGHASGSGAMRSGIVDAADDADRLAEVLDGAGLGSLARRDDWVARTPEVVPQSPMSNIYDWEPNAVPALAARLETGSAWLACLVYGDPAAARA